MICVPMAPSKRSSSAPRRPLFSHRRLLVSEAVLVLGLVQMVAKDWVLAQTSLPAAVRVGFGMALTLGVFGGLFLVAQRQVQRSLSTTHRVVQRLPLPTPVAAVHAIVCMLLFFGYARYWDLDKDVARAVVSSASETQHAVTAALERR